MKTKQCLVIGLGRFGTAVATTLYEMGHEVVAIDRVGGRISLRTRTTDGRAASPSSRTPSSSRRAALANIRSAASGAKSVSSVFV